MMCAVDIERDARPFVAHHLRRRADARRDENGAALHELARWVENLPAGDLRMARIAATGALDYDDGSFVGGPEAEALIVAWEASGGPEARERWLDGFAAAVAEHWAD